MKSIALFIFLLVFLTLCSNWQSFSTNTGYYDDYSVSYIDENNNRNPGIENIVSCDPPDSLLLLNYQHQIINPGIQIDSNIGLTRSYGMNDRSYFSLLDIPPPFLDIA